MKTKKSVKTPVRHIAHFPKKSLKISSLAKKGGVSKLLVERLLKTARRTPDRAYPIVRVTRFLALGKFCRAYKAADRAKFRGLKPVRSIIVRGLRAVNPRFYAKHIAA